LKLLRELTRLQHEHGYIDDGSLHQLSRKKNVPLYQLEGLVSFYPYFRRTPPPRTTVHICRDVSCSMAGCDAMTRQLCDLLQSRNEVTVEEVSCLGRCDTAPAVAIDGIPLAPATLCDLDVVLAVVEGRQALPANEPTNATRIWKCDHYPDPTQHYGTVMSLVQSDSDVATVCIERLKQSNLRGMGGAGFPAGMKWKLVAAEPAQPKYVICNADESEPGTFKDRVILEELPHLVIEGLVLAGLTVGAETGIIYLRHEYSKEQKALESALSQARQTGILGDNAAGSGKRFEIEIFVSPGGYILGEETALLEVLEDKRGEPRNKPPYPGTHGLRGKPTLINNVETFALAAAIVHYGVEWWQSQGRHGSAGLKFVSVSGDVKKPDVYEIPLGTTVAELIELAGGMQDDKPLLAFLPGGASSNFLTADAADTPLDFDTINDAGSMLGTGAVIVMAKDRDLFALATNIVRFFRNESCGKCVPCRIGSQKAVDLLDGVYLGKISVKKLKLLHDLGDTLEQTSICGLGQVAINSILSMMKQFPDYDAWPLQKTRQPKPLR